MNHEAGKTLEYIDERDSSKRCSRCGHLQPMPLWKRTYRCQNCGLVLDRDENGAVNHYQRFFARLSSTHGRSRVVCGCVHRNLQRVTTFRKADLFQRRALETRSMVLKTTAYVALVRPRLERIIGGKNDPADEAALPS